MNQLSKYEAPAITAKAFSCPHCHAFAQQSWFSILAEPSEQEISPTVAQLNLARRDPRRPPTFAQLDHSWCEQILAGSVFFGRKKPHFEADLLPTKQIHLENLSLSECYSCRRPAIWIHERLLWPALGEGVPPPNADLSEAILADYAEAGRIVELSPRGAAALLRLAVQKLCDDLVGKGKKLNNQIKELVAKGLSDQVQKAFDVVRVVGNNAVHPGQIDLRDDRQTAMILFELVNLIADTMISQPKKVNAAYARLPQSALDEIVKRDGG